MIRALIQKKQPTVHDTLAITTILREALFRLPDLQAEFVELQEVSLRERDAAVDTKARRNAAKQASLYEKYAGEAYGLEFEVRDHWERVMQKALEKGAYSVDDKHLMAKNNHEVVTSSIRILRKHMEIMLQQLKTKGAIESRRVTMLFAHLKVLYGIINHGNELARNAALEAIDDDAFQEEITATRLSFGVLADHIDNLKASAVEWGIIKDDS